MGHDVFISYSSHDKKVADAACALIEQRGYPCWIAPRDILSGMEWGKAIVEGIRGARVFVLIFSANANRSPQVNREVERAVSHGLPIVPFRIEDVAPSDSLEYFISNQHWLDALTPPLARHLNRLGDVVGRLLGYGDAPRAAPAGGAKPEAPQRVGWTARAAMAIALVAFVMGVAWLLWNPNRPAPSAPVAVADLRAKAGPVVAPASPRPLEELVDFESVPLETTPGSIDAAAYLQRAAVPIQVSLSPPSARLVFMLRHNVDYRVGHTGGGFGEIEQGPSHYKLLVLQGELGGDTFLELRFAEQLSEIRLITPTIIPHPEYSPPFTDPNSFMAFPPLIVTALDAEGQIVARRSYPAWRSDEVRSSRWGTITLTSPNGRGIRFVRLRVSHVISADTNFQTDEAAPTASNPAFILVGISGRRMSSPAAAPQ